MSLASAIRETYLGFKSLLIGMRITGREALKPSLTSQYPHDTLKMPARFRGHIQLVLDPATGRPRCTACGLCVKACPSGCIDLDGLKREGEKKKSVSRYDLDFSMCSLCGSCVEVCPSDAIDFSKQYNVVSFNREQFAHMDLYAKIETESRLWAQTHPQPTPAAAVATTAAVVPAAGSAPSPAPSATKPAPAAVAIDPDITIIAPARAAPSNVPATKPPTAPAPTAAPQSDAASTAATNPGAQ
ncbi:MAG: NADH-quinone oxidoreductase subunit I [Opitutaceae bacterium]|nr:NADH-quinone oxidoreductase subunit I [Opitutaceae bacterium]